MRARESFMTSAVVLLTLSGCYLDYVVPPPKAATNIEIASRNVANLKKLTVGQSRDEVLHRMSMEPVEGCVEWSWEDWEFYLRHNGYLRCIRTELIRSPYRTATLENKGMQYEVLFYYTGGTSPDGGITDQQLTPVLIGGGQLVGWGWNHPVVQELRLTPSAR